MNGRSHMIETLVVWIRRELRVNDHLALWSAVQDGASVIPLFIVDEAFCRSAPARRLAVLDGLAALRSSLRNIGGELFLRIGEPKRVLHEMLRESGAGGVYSTKEYHPDVRLTDLKLKSSVEAAGKLWKEFTDQVLFEEKEILSKSRSAPYTVFTAYKNAWKERRRDIPPPLPSIRKMRVPEIPSGELPASPAASGPPPSAVRPVGGEAHGLKELDAFLSAGAGLYHRNRDFPAVPGTSRLSQHLSTGSLGIRTVYQKLTAHMASVRGLAKQGPETFLNQLIWREFYHQILANFPHVVRGSFKSAFDRLEWSSDERHLKAWQNGMTGYPIVDAAMRQLNAEGWMHNRCRMLVASFLTKDLHIDWKAGEAYFMRSLADGDVALNNGGWQWSAGTGNDAQPWFRIFNPLLQSKKFDPRGEYLRRYLPELARVPDRYIHEPRLMPPSVQAESGCRIGQEYPAPIVEHVRERERTLQYYGRIASEKRT